MFGDLDAQELSQIVHIMQVQNLRAGQASFDEGDPGDAWYVVYEGEVEVVKRTEDVENVIVTLGPRACFGEMAILDGAPRSAAVRAKVPTTLFRFPRAEFLKLLQANNLSAFKLVHQMALVLAKRQRQTTSRLVNLLAQAAAREVLGGLEPAKSDAE